MKMSFTVSAICLPLYNVLIFCFSAFFDWPVAMTVALSVVGSIAIGILIYKLVLSPFSDRYEDMEKALNNLREMEEIRRGFISEISEALREPASHLNSYLKEIVGIIKKSRNDGTETLKADEPFDVEEPKEEISRYARLYDVGEPKKKSEDLYSKKSKISRDLYESDIVDSTVPKALAEVERLVKLTDDLVVLLDVEQKVHISQGGRIDIDAAVSEVIDEFGDILDEKNLSVVIDIEDSLYIEGAKERFKIMVAKLLDNAIRYSEDGKTIWITGDNINGYIVVSIRDEGYGITADDQKKIFERFYRGLNSKTIYPIGSGLGLPIAKHLAYLLDAEIKVKSTYGEGSTFSVIFKRGL